MGCCARLAPDFDTELERSAKRWGLARADTLEFRFRRRYGLPPTDPRFLDATPEDIVIDFWAHCYLDDPKLRSELTTDDFDAEADAMEREAEEAELARVAAAAVPDDEWDVVEDVRG